MFCYKCGNQLQEGAKFCPVCGENVQGTDVAEQSNMNDRDRSVTVVSMNEAGIEQHEFNTRIEAVSNKAANDALFTLYKKLVTPVSEIEYIETNRPLMLQKASILKNTPKKKVTVRECLLDATIFSFHFKRLILIIVGLYAGAYWQVRRDTLPHMFHTIPFICVLILFLLEMLRALGQFLYYLLKLPVEYAKKYKDEYEKRQKDAVELEEKVAEMKPREEYLLSQIHEVIQYVPPKYRTSDALKFFADAYLNSEVNNLQEAVKAYGVEKRHSEVKAGMETIGDKLDKANDILGDIDATLKGINSEMENIDASIWTANVLF